MQVAIVGAGVAGLMAGRALVDAGCDVTLFDKGRSPGGRLATRRIGGARVDHGAQFLTVRTDEFDRIVGPWRASGLMYEWCRGFGPEPDGHPRFAVRGGMNALAKHLADGLDVRLSALAFAVRTGRGRRWALQLDDGSRHDADALVVTCPLPQAYSLLVSADVAVPDRLWRTEYDRTLALLAVLDSRSDVPEPGGVQHDPAFTFVADNRMKGISDVTALTFHANPAWSLAHWDDEHDLTRAALIGMATPYVGRGHIVDSELKRWRFATPQAIWPDACWLDESGTIALAGDAFAGPRVEGAALSGLAAAHHLLA